MITDMRKLFIEAYNAFVDEFKAWQLMNESDPDFFNTAPDFFDFIARYLVAHGAVLE